MIIEISWSPSLCCFFSTLNSSSLCFNNMDWVSIMRTYKSSTCPAPCMVHGNSSVGQEHSITKIWLGGILKPGASNIVSQWGSSIRPPWVHIVTSQWYDRRCCSDLKIQQTCKLHFLYDSVFAKYDQNQAIQSNTDWNRYLYWGSNLNQTLSL